MTLKVGIVGLGRMGKTHAEHLSKYINGVELVAACSLFQSELDYAKEHFGVKLFYNK